MIARAQQVLKRMPPLRGRPIEVRYQRESAHVHAGSFLRERRISLDPSLRADEREFGRILVHEIFHFVWLRLGNARRLSFEALMEEEWRCGTGGELGWSAEWRKAALRRHDVERRSKAWRLYCCESFCDTAAWLFAGAGRHDEFTLDGRARRLRRSWFGGLLRSLRTLPV